MTKYNFISKEELCEKCNTLFPDNFKENQSYEIASIFKQEMDNTSNLEIKNTFNLLQKIFSCCLDIESRDFFKPIFSNGTQRSFVPDDLNQNKLDYLSDIVNIINQPFLKSRISDILWCYKKPKNIQHARIAIESYMNNDFNKFSVDNYIYWHRATILAISTNQKDLLDKIKEKLLSEINSPTSDWHFHKLKIAEIFLKTGLDKNSFEKLADAMQQEGKKFNAKSEDFHEVDSYLKLAIELFSKSGNRDKEIECIHLLAKSTEEHGDFRANDSKLAANCFYKKSLQIYRKIPSKYRQKYNTEQHLANIESKITQSGTLMLDEMESFTIDKDISELQNNSINHVKDKKTLCESLCYFSGVSSIDSKAILQDAQKHIEQSVLMHIAPHTAISQDGRTIERISPLESDRSNYDEVLFKTAIQHFGIRMNLAVSGCILPALEQIQNEYIVSKEFLIWLCHLSPIVPPKRQILVATALYYGFERDFATSIHLLAPQVENMVRQLFKDEGITTTHTDENGIENEVGLSSLIDKAEAKEILGKDIWFQLQAVFTNPLSSNLRNMVGHGLLDDGTSNSPFNVYAWWLILRIIIRSILK
ncbi:DUF4209 domain-containing protein [Actinobacillus vicugnae]|uniref:DUF4209 domain-containing protein n=1 Tax=Actinobacillus vicugnae TaxID=2573093 RepID=UPI001240B50E|nr:DUF4209 domain-containing protein [Actinobacillus vicugnae]